MLDKLSVPLFGRLLENQADHLESIQNNLRKANMKATAFVYVCNTLFLALIAFLVVITAGTLSLTLMLHAAVYSFTLSILIGAGVAALVVFLSYTYPSVRLRSLETHINRSLPFAILYLSTAASAGIGPVQLFRMLAAKGGIIGEEANKIHTNVSSLGMDLPTALQKVADRTPSKVFADLLWGMISAITTGASLDSYLRNKSHTMMSLYRRTLREYSRQISLYTEIYITLIIIGSLFFIILVALISPFVGISILFLQGFLVFFVIPFLSVAYLLVVKSLNPQET